MTSPKSPRSLDHLVLPVADTDAARARYEALGFTVAPDGKHPFGTENCCVFLADGSFLEPLGIAQRETCELTAKKGNTFTRNDQTYRFRRGLEGCSHLVVKSDDARADDKLYRAEGISGGKMVRFSRSFETPEGKKDKASFALAFAADPRAPDAYFFACEVVSAPDIDRTPLEKHANGAVSLKEVVLSETNPTDFQYFFQTFLNQRAMDSHSFGMEFETASSKVSVLTPAGTKAFCGFEAITLERGLRFEAFVLGSGDLGKTAAALKDSGVAFTDLGHRLLVPPAPGQGIHILFEKA